MQSIALHRTSCRCGVCCDAPLAGCRRVYRGGGYNRAGVAMSGLSEQNTHALPCTSAQREGYVSLSLSGMCVVVEIESATLDGPRDEARIEASADQAEAIGRAFLEWSARARARQHSNAQPELFGFLS